MRQEQKNSYGYEKIIVLPRVQQEARMVTPLIRWAEPQAATIRSLRKLKNMAVTSEEGNGKCQPGIVLRTVLQESGFLCSQQGTGMFTTSTDTAVVDEDRF